MEGLRAGCLTPGHAGPGSHRDLAVGLDDVRAVSGPLHRSTPLLRRCEHVVGIAHGDDLAVAGLRTLR